MSKKKTHHLATGVSCVEDDGSVLLKIAEGFGVEFDFIFEFTEHPTIFGSKMAKGFIEIGRFDRETFFTIQGVPSMNQPHIVAKSGCDLDESTNFFPVFIEPNNDRPFSYQIESA